ncbi:MAG TPA: hypothetical protein VFV37_01730 [Luteibaculaceae bacterium]|nr:hypothetical protein [Luteibaculaceae bacterium]
MRVVIVLIGVVLGVQSFAQGVFQSKTGNRSWGTAADWTLVSGNDADGIPDSDDQVNIIRGSRVSVSGTQTAQVVQFRMDLGTNGSTAHLDILSGARLNALRLIGLHNGSGNGGNPSEQLVLTVQGDLLLTQDALFTNQSNGGNTGVPGNITVNITATGSISAGNLISATNSSPDGSINLTTTKPLICNRFQISNSNNGTNSFTGPVQAQSDVVIEQLSTANGINGTNRVSFNGASLAQGNLVLSTASYAGMNEVEIAGQMRCATLTIRSGQALGTVSIDNQLTLGKGATAGTLQCDDIQFAAPSGGTQLRNEIQWINGTIVQAGTLSMTGGTPERNQISIVNTSAGYAKQWICRGILNPNSSGRVIFSDASIAANYTFSLEGAGVKNLPAGNAWPYDRLILKTGDLVNLMGPLVAGSEHIYGSLELTNGTTLSDEGNIVAPSELILRANSKYRAVGPGSTFPAGPGLITTEAGVAVSYVNNSAQEMATFRTPANAVQFARVDLLGTGVKQQAGPIGDLITVEQIHVQEGTFKIGIHPLELSASAQTGSRTLHVLDQGTLDIAGTVAPSPSNFYVMGRLSGVRYSGGNQDIAVFRGADGKTLPYGNLYLSGSGIKSTTANTSVLGELSIGPNTTLNINDATLVTLVSNAQGSAWMSEVLGGINYNTSGKFVVQKYFDFGNYRARYRDFSSPVRNTTLRSWSRVGFPFYGFPGSNFPTTTPADFYYRESVPNNMNLGFTAVKSLDDTMIIAEGNHIKYGGLRMFTGRTVTISDTGQIFQGTVTQELHYTDVSDYKFDNGWNLIVNPYPTALDFDKIVRDPANATMFLDPNCNGEGHEKRGLGVNYIQWMPYDNNRANVPEAYSYYNSFSGMSWFPKGGIRIDNIIPAFGSFWIKTRSVKDVEAWNLTIKESHKASNHGRFYKGADIQHLLTRMEIAGNNQFAELGMYQWPCADVNFDAYDIEGTGVTGGSALTLRFFDVDEGIMDLWVNAFSNKGKTIEQRLWVHIPSSGTFTLSFSNLEPLFDGYSCAVLYDSIAGEYIDLKEQTSYTFASDGYTGVRFIIYLTPIKKGNTLKSIDWASISDAPVCELGNKPSPVNSEKANTCNALTKQRVELGNSVYLDARLTDAGNTLNGEVSASENWMVAWKWQGEIYPSQSIQIYKTAESQTIEVVGYDSERACRTGQLLSVKGIFDEAASGVKIWGGETGIQYQSEERVESITVYGLDGKQIWHNIAPSQRDLISLPNQRGVFIVSLKTVNQTVSSRVYLP